MKKNKKKIEEEIEENAYKKETDDQVERHYEEQIRTRKREVRNHRVRKINIGRKNEKKKGEKEHG